MSHESWVTTSSASTMELPSRPPTGLLLRDSGKGERSRHWHQRLSTFSNRRGGGRPPVPPAFDLRASRQPTMDVVSPFDRPADVLRSPRQEQPIPVLPEAEEDAYWRDGMKEWIAAQPSVTEYEKSRAPVAMELSTMNAPVSQPSDPQPKSTPSPIGLGITLPRGVHFGTPYYPTYREESTVNPAFPVYRETITSSAISSIYDAYTGAATPSHQAHNIASDRPTHEGHARSTYPERPNQRQRDLPSATSSASSTGDFEKADIKPPHCPATEANAVPITASRGLTDVEKMDIRGFPSPGAAHPDDEIALRTTVKITAKSKAWQLRLHRRHRRRVIIISLSVLALLCMVSGVIAALVTAGREKDSVDAARDEVNLGVSGI